MEELRQIVEVILGQALNLVSALVDFLWTSSISLPALTFLGINIIAFLLGLLLGRISKHEVPEVLDNSIAREEDRVVLDLERLRPLGLSTEEVVENQVMDISGLRPGETTKGTSQGDTDRRQRPESAPQR
jgi:hypothetical protein